MLFGKYLRQRTTETGTTFQWYRLGAGTLLMAGIVILMILYGLAGLFGWESLGDLEVRQMSPAFATGYWVLTGMSVLVLLFDRGSSLIIGNDGDIQFKKRTYTARTHKFNRRTIQRVEKKEPLDLGESTPGISGEIYYFYIYLSTPKTLCLGSFSEEDCKLLEKELMS